VVAIGSDGHLWHTIRDANNQWQGNMGEIANVSAGGPPSFKRVACSGDSDGGLNIVALGSDGQLWHTARRSNGTWFAQFDQVSSDSPGAPAGLMSVGAGNDTNDDMQVVSVAPDGTLWHTIRHDPGNWQATTGKIPTAGGPPQFTRISDGSGTVPSGNIQYP
jgi:hypothetical protein